MALQDAYETNNPYISIYYDVYTCDFGCFLTCADEDGLIFLTSFPALGQLSLKG